MFDRVLAGFSNQKIQVITGQRCVIKDRVIDQVKQKLDVDPGAIFHYNLDDILTRLDFEIDPGDFTARFEKSSRQKLAHLPHPVYFVFEQIQSAKQLFPLIANLKRINPKQVHILLTSSINLADDPDYVQYLAPISDIHLVYPPTLWDLVAQQGISLNDHSILRCISKGEFDLDYFHDVFHFAKPYQEKILNTLKDYLLFSGVHLLNKNRDNPPDWDLIRANLRDYFEQILVSVYQISDLKKFDQILRIFALNNGNILNLLKMCDHYGINRNTMRKYSGILSDTFLIDYVPPYLKQDVNKPIMRTPKVYFYNNGLVNYLNGITTYQSLENSIYFQSNLDGMLLSNLRSVIAQSGQEKEITFLRDYQNHELDFLISTEKGLVPVGISMDDDNRKTKIKTFRYYLRYCQQIYHGAIFSTYQNVECIEMKGSKLYLLPIWMLW
jgi:predicted AAA+ superfamily ATPase